MRHIKAVLFGLFAVTVFGFAASCGDQPLQPNTPDRFELNASLGDTPSVTPFNIPWPPPDSTGPDSSDTE
jgi:hypothetical protein